MRVDRRGTLSRAMPAGESASVTSPFGAWWDVPALLTRQSIRSAPHSARMPRSAATKAGKAAVFPVSSCKVAARAPVPLVEAITSSASACLR